MIKIWHKIFRTLQVLLYPITLFGVIVVFFGNLESKADGGVWLAGFYSLGVPLLSSVVSGVLFIIEYVFGGIWFDNFKERYKRIK